MTGKNADVSTSAGDLNAFSKVFVEYGAATYRGEADRAPGALYDAIRATGRRIVAEMVSNISRLHYGGATPMMSGAVENEKFEGTHTLAFGR